uniref:Keratin-associated protein 6-2-like n=1 Tax=Syphacia muris TaxID=451379 RepID=A0A0N5AYE1_9BILA
MIKREPRGIAYYDGVPMSLNDYDTYDTPVVSDYENSAYLNYGSSFGAYGRACGAGNYGSGGYGSGGYATGGYSTRYDSGLGGMRSYDFQNYG